MTIYRTVVTLPSTTGEPADSVQNVLHWNVPTTLDVVELFTAIVSFYNVQATGAAGAVGAYISRAISRATDGATVDLYELPAVAGPVGSPVAGATFTLLGTDNAATSLPSECAVTLSFRADLAGFLEESGATRPRARRRGRIYIGPVNTNALSNGPGVVGDQRVSASMRDSLTKAAKEFLTDTAGDTGAALAVFSPTNWLAPPVEQFWVDDAIDIQRRRGTGSSVRTILDV